MQGHMFAHDVCCSFFLTTVDWREDARHNKRCVSCLECCVSCLLDLLCVDGADFCSSIELKPACQQARPMLSNIAVPLLRTMAAFICGRQLRPRSKGRHGKVRTV